MIKRLGQRVGQGSLEKNLAVLIDVWKFEKHLEAPQRPTYMRELSKLIHLWRSELPGDPEAGGFAAQWLQRHLDVLSRINMALQKRRYVMGIEPRSDGTPEIRERPISVENDPEKHEISAAYLRLADFLAGQPEIMRFCARCEKPFLKEAQKWKYCSLRCAQRKASSSFHLQKRGMKERKRLKRAATFLKKWLSKPSHRAGSIWWRDLQQSTEFQDEYGFQTSDGRRSRTLGAYITAAETPPGSPERNDLLKMLSYGLSQPNELTKIQSELDHFLDYVKIAGEVTTKKGK